MPNRTGVPSARSQSCRQALMENGRIASPASLRAQTSMRMTLDPQRNARLGPISSPRPTLPPAVRPGGYACKKDVMVLPVFLKLVLDELEAVFGGEAVLALRMEQALAGASASFTSTSTPSTPSICMAAQQSGWPVALSDGSRTVTGQGFWTRRPRARMRRRRAGWRPGASARGAAEEFTTVGKKRGSHICSLI